MLSSRFALSQIIEIVNHAYAETGMKEQTTTNLWQRNYNIHKNNIHSQLAPPLTGLKYILSIKYSKICQLLYDSED